MGSIIDRMMVMMIMLSIRMIFGFRRFSLIEIVWFIFWFSWFVLCWNILFSVLECLFVVIMNRDRVGN